MDTRYQFTSTAHWTARHAGIVNAESVEHPILFSAPPEFHGEPGLWTPEHFLMAAVAGCFVATFTTIAEMWKFELVSLEVSVEGLLGKIDGGLQFTRVAIRPVLTIAQETDRERALRLLEKSERSCLVARSLRIEVAVESSVLVLAPVPVISITGRYGEGMREETAVSCDSSCKLCGRV